MKTINKKAMKNQNKNGREYFDKEFAINENKIGALNGFKASVKIKDFISDLLEEQSKEIDVECPQYQTVYQAIIKSKEWNEWHKLNEENPKGDVNETAETGGMSDEHGEAFVKFIRNY